MGGRKKMTGVSLQTEGVARQYMRHSTDNRYGGVNDVASDKEAPIQTLGQRPEILVLDGVTGVKLYDGTKLVRFRSSVMSRKLTTGT